MLAVVCQHNNRMCATGSDPRGSFAWTKFRGNRDEGIFVMSAYGVSQTKETNAGPITAYSQQINEMTKAGNMTLDSRSRILTYLRDLITDKRAAGFRPILMIDDNHELFDKGSKKFQRCVDEMNLVNHLHQKHSHTGIVPTI